MLTHNDYQYFHSTKIEMKGVVKNDGSDSEKYEANILAKIIEEEIKDIKKYQEDRYNMIAFQKSLTLILKVSEEAINWDGLANNKRRDQRYKFIVYSNKYIIPCLKKSKCEFVSSITSSELYDMRNSMTHRGFPFPPYLLERLFDFSVLNKVIGVNKTKVSSTTSALIEKPEKEFRLINTFSNQIYYSNEIRVPIMNRDDQYEIEYDYKELVDSILNGVSRTKNNLKSRNYKNEKRGKIELNFPGRPHKNKNSYIEYPQELEHSLLVSMSRYYRNIIFKAIQLNQYSFVIDLFYVWIEIKIKADQNINGVLSDKKQLEILKSNKYNISKKIVPHIDRIKNHNKHYLTRVSSSTKHDLKKQRKEIVSYVSKTKAGYRDNKTARKYLRKIITDKNKDIEILSDENFFDMKIDFIDKSSYKIKDGYLVFSQNRTHVITYVRGIDSKPLVKLIQDTIHAIDEHIPRNYYIDMYSVKNPFKRNSRWFSSEDIEELTLFIDPKEVDYSISFREMRDTITFPIETDGIESHKSIICSDFSTKWLIKCLDFYAGGKIDTDKITVKNGFVIDSNGEYKENIEFVKTAFAMVDKMNFLDFRVNPFDFLTINEVTKEEMIKYLVDKFNCSQETAKNYFYT